MRRLIWCGLAAVALVVIGSCSSDASTAASTSTSTKSTGPSVTVTMTDFNFSPTTISAKAGTTLTVKLVNSGQAEHNFTVKALKIDKDVEAGESASVQVKVPTASTPFYCEYHKARGMTGNLVVTS